MDHIDQLTLWQVIDLLDYWRGYPPTHVLLGAYLMGRNSTASGKRRRGVQAGRFDELVLAVGSLGGTIYNKLPGTYR